MTKVLIGRYRTQLVWIGMLLLAGCGPGGGVNPPEPASVTGALSAWVGGSSSRIQAVVRSDNGSPTVLGTVNIGVDGAFSLPLPASVDAGLLRPFGASRSGCSGNVTVSDPGAGTAQAEFFVLNDSGYIGDVLTNLGADQASWTYADRAVRVSGQETCASTASSLIPGADVRSNVKAQQGLHRRTLASSQAQSVVRLQALGSSPTRSRSNLRTLSSSLGYSFDLNLKPGWNLVTYTSSNDSISVRSASGNPGWRVAGANDLSSKPNGADAGSDGARLRGNVGAGGATRLSLEILRRKADQKSLVNGVTASVDASGNFDLTLPASVDTGYLEPLSGLNTACSGGLTLSDAGAQYGEAVVAAAKGAQRVGEARALGYAHEVSWWYADRAANITGQQVCTLGNAPNTTTRTYDFNLALLAGWNLVVSSQTSKGGETVNVRGGPVPPATRWLVASDDEIPTPGPVGLGGADAGSTATNPKGTLGNWANTQSAPGILNAVLSDETVLAQTAINADGSFNLSLPASVDASNLPELDLSVGCTGKLSYGTPDVKGDFVYLDPYRADEPLGFTVAGGDGFEVHWVYVSSATTVGGSEVCTDGDGATETYTYNLSLAAGWNLVADKVTLSGENIIVNSTNGALPSGTKWYFERIEDEGGPDQGSTPSLLKGQLPSNRAGTTLAVTLRSRDALGAPVLTSSPVGADGGFTVNLPSSVDTAQSALSSLSFDDGCTGVVTLSDPSSKVGVLEFELRAASTGFFVGSVEVSGANSEGSALSLDWWYADKATTATGNQTCTGATQDSQRRVNLKLVAGWNLVLTETKTNLGGEKVTTLTTQASAPADVRWQSY